MNFSSLDLAPEIQKAVDACGYRQMTDIQKQAIVPARRGMDLLANAQTGTGKTAAFTIPVLQRMLDKPEETVAENPRVLILTPTRELAEQLAEAIKGYAQFTSFSVLAIYGGVKLSGQKKKGCNEYILNLNNHLLRAALLTMWPFFVSDVIQNTATRIRYCSPCVIMA